MENKILLDKKSNTQSIRLNDYDYSQAGFYYVTMCTAGKKHFFGNINDGKMQLSQIGKVIKNFWQQTSNHFKHVHLDEFIIMPNHLHGIIIVNPIDHSMPLNLKHTLAKLKPASQQSEKTLLTKTYQINRIGRIKPHSLPVIIGSFKSAAKRWCNKFGYHNFGWQSRYYDHIIRDEQSLNNIRQYIINNPLKWDLDINNPINFNRISDTLMD